MASRAEALAVDSSYSTGKIIADLTIPPTAYTTLTSSKALSIEYSLQILFDMRAKTSFLERKSKKVVTSKLRNKLLSCPGGFEVEIPIVVGTLSDGFHMQKPSPFVQGQAVAEFLIGNGSAAVPSVNNSRSDTSLTPSNSAPSSSPSSTTPVPSMRLPASPARPSDSTTHASSSIVYLQQSTATVGPPRYSMAVQRSGHSDSSPTTTFRSRSATSPINNNILPTVGLSPYPSPTLLADIPHSQLPLIYESMSKPLPKIPSSQQPVMLPTPSARRASAISMPGQSGLSEVTAPVLPPRLPPRPPVPSTSTSLPATSSSSAAASSSRYNTYNTNEYHSEKEQREPRPAPIQLPSRFTVEVPTAPEAINLGLGPASPLEHPQHANLTPGLASHLSTQDSWIPHEEGEQSVGGGSGSRVMEYSPPQISTTIVHSPVSEADLEMITKGGLDLAPKLLTERQIHAPGATLEPTPDPRNLRYAYPAASAPPLDSP